MQHTIFILLLFPFFSFTQIKGKAKRLPGIWEYKEGSGVEIWNYSPEETYLIGSGYRSNKLGDSIKVEDLKIELVKKNLVYTLITEQVFDSTIQRLERQYLGKRKKLHFESMRGDEPKVIRYKFGVFNKNKLTIIIQMNDHVKPNKLYLRKRD